MQRDLTLMLLKQHELRAMREAAQSVLRVSREMDDDDAIARAHSLIRDVDAELELRVNEQDDAPF